MKKKILQFPESIFIDSYLLYCMGISQKKGRTRCGEIETCMKNLFA